MAHPNAELATSLEAWERTGHDNDNIVRAGQRKGFIIVLDGKHALSGKGRDFLEKWLGGRK